MKIYFKEKGKDFVCLTDRYLIEKLLGTDTSYVDNPPLRRAITQVDPNVDSETGGYSGS